MTQLIEKTLSDADFPKRHLNDASYEENGAVYQNFTNSDKKSMRRKFTFAKFNCDGKYATGEQIRDDFDVLIWSAEFI